MNNSDKPVSVTTALRRENTTALYRQIAAHLRENIEAGLYEPHGRLPSETQIRSQFNVSRVTVRLALDQLEEEGLIRRQQGKGSYVAGKQVRYGLDNLRSFHVSLKLQGLDATMQLLEKKQIPIPRELTACFPDSTHCLYIRRLHCVDDEPVALGISYLPDALSSISNELFEQEPAYSQLTRIMGRPPFRADMSIRAQSADSSLADILRVPEHHALLVMQRTSYFEDGICCDRSFFYIRPDRYEFNLSSVFKPA